MARRHFDNEITKDIRLEAYYWETKTLNKTVVFNSKCENFKALLKININFYYTY